MQTQMQNDALDPVTLAEQAVDSIKCPLEKAATHLRAMRYQVDGSVAEGRLFLEDGDILGSLEDHLEKDVLSQLTLYREVIDYGCQSLHAMVVIELGRTISPEERYRGRFHEAVADAAEAMIWLNRYAKRCCEREDREQIYRQKDALLKLLCRRDLCVGWWLHEQEYEARSSYDADDEDLEDEDLNVDDGDEEDWEPPVAVRRFVAFTFQIRGKRYTWHAPESKVEFDYTAFPRLPDIRTSSDHEPAEQDCPTFNLTAALDLVDYVTFLARALEQGAA